MRDFHLGKRLVAALLYLFLAQPKLQRAESHVIKDRRAEKLDIRVLKNKPYLAVEAKRVLPVGDRLDVLPERPHSALARPVDAVKQLEQRRLAAAVRAEQHNLLSPRDIEVNAVKGYLPPAVQVPDTAQMEDRLGSTVMAVY